MPHKTSLAECLCLVRVPYDFQLCHCQFLHTRATAGGSLPLRLYGDPPSGMREGGSPLQQGGGTPLTYYLETIWYSICLESTQTK